MQSMAAVQWMLLFFGRIVTGGLSYGKVFHPMLKLNSSLAGPSGSSLWEAQSHPLVLTCLVHRLRVTQELSLPPLNPSETPRDVLHESQSTNYIVKMGAAVGASCGSHHNFGKPCVAAVVLSLHFGCRDIHVRVRRHCQAPIQQLWGWKGAVGSILGHPDSTLLRTGPAPQVTFPLHSSCLQPLHTSP